MGKYQSEEVNPIDCCKKCASQNNCGEVCNNINKEYCAKESCIPGECSENGKFISIVKKHSIIDENYIEISTYNLLDNYKDNWEVQFKIPPVDLWVDCNMKTSSLISTIAFHQMNAKWRYKIEK